MDRPRARPHLTQLSGASRDGAGYAQPTCARGVHGACVSRWPDRSTLRGHEPTFRVVRPAAGRVHNRLRAATHDSRTGAVRCHCRPSHLATSATPTRKVLIATVDPLTGSSAQVACDASAGTFASDVVL